MAVQKDKTKTENTERRVVLVGTSPIMFDRYAGDNDTKLEPWKLSPATKRPALPVNGKRNEG